MYRFQRFEKLLLYNRSVVDNQENICNNWLYQKTNYLGEKPTMTTILQITAPQSEYSERFNVLAPITGMTINEEQNYKQITLGCDPFNAIIHSFHFEDDLQFELDKISDENGGKRTIITEVILRVYIQENGTFTELELGFGDHGLGFTLINVVSAKKASFEDWL